ncbi:MAG: ribosome biogenesis GTPase Der, partial [Planctomycetia bacterium]|nr:ribosome biogenesis GTPase Der [Planctomycetia bacterium]
VTQVDVHPPTIVVFVNDPELFSEAYRRYLAARFREMGLFNEVAIKIYFKGRHPSAAEPTTT